MKCKLNAFPLAGMLLETDQRGPLRFTEGRDTAPMAAMKPRTGDGPMEVTKEGRSLIMRVPIDGGGRLVVELNADEAAQLRECLVGVTE
ncbi:hypothetical protein NCCP1664_03000 [Zafaria cholistanensis]|uniref:DUF3117 domain-containing protein n=2 Tax=Micrococcaceae TaxID=1268 RepID=A0A5A7NLI5_9MICC|nr:hypothetical protein NCCP1664_03000 [Zafaria cholistanensis]